MAEQQGTASRIADLALQRFRIDGFAGTSVADLAIALGISKAAIYHHYRSKTELLHRLVDPLLDAVDACIDAHSQPSAQAGAQAGATRPLLAAYLGVLTNHHQIAALVASDTAITNHPEIGPRIREQNRRLRTMLAGPDTSVPATLRAEAALGAIWRPLVNELDVSLADAAHQRTLVPRREDPRREDPRRGRSRRPRCPCTIRRRTGTPMTGSCDGLLPPQASSPIPAKWFADPAEGRRYELRAVLSVSGRRGPGRTLDDARTVHGSAAGRRRRPNRLPRRLLSAVRAGPTLLGLVPDRGVSWCLPRMFRMPASASASPWAHHRIGSLGPREPAIMTHSNPSTLPVPQPAAPATQPDLPARSSSARLRLDPALGRRGAVDGGWWPRSRDASAELPALITALDERLATTTSRVSVHVDAWDNIPRRLRVGGRVVRVGWYRSMDAHGLSVILARGDPIQLLVIPAQTAQAQAGIAMAMAAAGNDAARPTDILAASNAAAGRAPRP